MKRFLFRLRLLLVRNRYGFALSYLGDGTGEAVCPECKGTGFGTLQMCPVCGGSGTKGEPR